MEENYYTPITIYQEFPKYRSVLESWEVIAKRDDGTLFLPGFKVKIDKKGFGAKDDTLIKNNYPFYHQKLLFMIDTNGGNWQKAMDDFQKTRAFQSPRGSIISLL